MPAHRKLQLLGVDIDNVVSLTDPALRKSIRDLYGLCLSQEQIVYYDYSKCGLTEDQERKVLETFRDVTCEELDVVPGAIEALTILKQKYRIILVTSRHPQLIEKTKDWLKLKKIPIDKLIFESDKHQTDHDFDFFVEDNEDSALALAQARITTFLFDYPWNRSIPFHDNIKRVLGWQDVLAELMGG
jgi:uncharacterized HAD superfamily protein